MAIETLLKDIINQNSGYWFDILGVIL